MQKLSGSLEELSLQSAAKMSKSIVSVRSSDGDVFEMEESVARVSETLKHMIEDDCTENIPLPNVSGSIMAKVIDYCKKHAEPNAEADVESSSTSDASDLKEWDAQFLKSVKKEKNTLFELILAANYLNIEGLLDITCQAAADNIKDMDVEGVREYFNIQNDYTQEEEALVRSENQWAFDN